jgi:hypothetical protein
VARNKSTARDLGAYLCFEDEAGQGLRPPKGRTWAPRGARPVVTVRGAGGGRVSIAGVVCYRPGDRPRLFYQLLVHRRRKGEPKGFAWSDYRDLIIATHRQLAAPLVWCWDNLNLHLAPQLTDPPSGLITPATRRRHDPRSTSSTWLIGDVRRADACCFPAQFRRRP